MHDYEQGALFELWTESWVTHSKTSPIATLSTTNPKWAKIESDLRGEKSALQKVLGYHNTYDSLSK
jgi:hypothetical protein